jgi:hypothetical protein
MKKYIFALAGIFVSTVAIVLALRMSPDAMAVIIGIICGMLASVPTTVLLMYTMRQRDQQQQQFYQQQHGPQYPPVVVVNGQPQQGYPAPPSQAAGHGFLPSPMNGRSFRVVGQEANQGETFGEAFGISALWDDEK